MMMAHIRLILVSVIVVCLYFLFGSTSFAGEGILGLGSFTSKSFSNDPVQKLRFAVTGGVMSNAGVKDNDPFSGLFLPGISIGYDVRDNISAEVSFAYSRVNSQQSSLASNSRFVVSGDMSYRIIELYNVTPYLGLGLSYVADSYTTFNNYNSSQGDIAGDLLGGFDVGFMENLALGFRTKYQSFFTSRKQYAYSPFSGGTAINVNDIFIENLKSHEDILNFMGVITFRIR